MNEKLDDESKKVWKRKQVWDEQVQDEQEKQEDKKVSIVMLSRFEQVVRNQQLLRLITWAMIVS